MTQPIEHADGIYIGMPEEEYFADPALGSSSLRDLDNGPLHYWVNSELNPDRKEEDDASDSAIRGKAYHALICEGQKPFAERFAPKFNPDEFPGALDTMNDLRAFCKEHGISPGKDKTTAAAAIVEQFPRQPIMMVHEKAHLNLHKGKTLLPVDTWKWLDFARTVMRQSGALGLFTNGVPEISFFWTLNNGIRCRARIDYLSASVAVNLKTYVNPLHTPPDKRVVNVIAQSRYDIQACHEITALNLISAFLARDNVTIVRNNAHCDVEDLLGKLADADPLPSYLMCFQEFSSVPSVTVREFAKREFTGHDTVSKAISGYWRKATEDVANALRTFESWRDQDIEGPWVPGAVGRKLDTSEFPAWFITKE